MGGAGPNWTSGIPSWITSPKSHSSGLSLLITQAIQGSGGQGESTCDPLPTLVVEHQPAHVPVAILKRRIVLHHNKEVHQVLVQWSDLSLEKDSWEDTDSLDLSGLVDKSPLQGSWLLRHSLCTHIGHTRDHNAQPITLPKEVRLLSKLFS